MKLLFVHSYKDGHEWLEQVTQYDNVLRIEFEDQTLLENGMWIHIWLDTGEQTSIEFETFYDWFRVID